MAGLHAVTARQQHKRTPSGEEHPGKAMSESTTASDVLDKAIEMTAERRRSAPSFLICQSIEAQLTYLKRLLDGQERDKARLKDIIIGVYAIREFEASDPEYAAILNQAQLIASRMTWGSEVR
jgi:predicted transcriptional regulator